MGNDIFFEMHDGTFDISFPILFVFSFICVNVLLNCLLFQFKRRKDFEHYTGINISETILKFRKILKFSEINLLELHSLERTTTKFFFFSQFKTN